MRKARLRRDTGTVSARRSSAWNIWPRCGITNCSVCACSSLNASVAIERKHAGQMAVGYERQRETVLQIEERGFSAKIERRFRVDDRLLVLGDPPGQPIVNLDRTAPAASARRCPPQTPPSPNPTPDR